MAITVIEPPAGVILRAHDWRISQPTRATTSAIDGGVQVASAGADRWTARLDWRVVGYAAREEWRGFVADLRGRLRAVRLTPPSTLSVTAAGDGVTFSDIAAFSDAARFQTSYLVDVAAPARARQIIVAGVDVSAFRRGMIFGVGDHAHMVSGVVSAGASRATVRIAPGLRVAAPAGTGLSLRPSVAMRLTDDAAGGASWTPERFMDAGLELVEVFP